MLVNTLLKLWLAAALQVVVEMRLSPDVPPDGVAHTGTPPVTVRTCEVEPMPSLVITLEPVP